MSKASSLVKEDQSRGGIAAWRAITLLVVSVAFVGCSHESKFFGLVPKEPHSWQGDCASVTSLQPTLRWDKFSLPEVMESPPGTNASVTAITYEIRVWGSAHDAPGQLVYSREGLSENFHTVQEPLTRGTSYFWSVRARFLLKGAPRVTDWGQERRRTFTETVSRGKFMQHEYYQYYCFKSPS